MGDHIKERLVERAAKDPVIMDKLIELTNLDARCRTGLPVQSPKWQAMAKRVSDLCDEIAAMVPRPGDDVDEISMWISYHCQEVMQELKGKLNKIEQLFKRIAIAGALFFGVISAIITYQGTGGLGVSLITGLITFGASFLVARWLLRFIL